MSEETRRDENATGTWHLRTAASITAWARDNNVPRPTVYRWAKEPEVRKAVQAFRRRTLDRAVGMMVKRVPWAVARIIKLADNAESESVRLRALRDPLHGHDHRLQVFGAGRPHDRDRGTTR